MSETCWAHKKRNKITSDIKLVPLFFNYYKDSRSNKHKIHNNVIQIVLILSQNIFYDFKMTFCLVQIFFSFQQEVSM